jgi:hypothetical protein
VKNAVGMGVVKRFGELLRNVCGALRLDLAFVDHLVEGFPFDEVHGEVVAVPLGADVVDGHDVRVVAELGHGLGLAVKALDGFLRRVLPGDEHLQRHAPLELGMESLVDHAHAAAPDLFLDFIGAERPPRAGGE